MCCPKSVEPGNILPNQSVCGLDFRDKIVGGNITGLTEFPWMALILFRNTSRLTGSNSEQKII